MSNIPPQPQARSCTPILRLRPDIDQAQSNFRKSPDGAYLRHPGEIDEDSASTSSAQFESDMSMGEYRVARKRDKEKFFERVRNAQKGMTKDEKRDMFKILQVITVPPLVDTKLLQTSTDEVIERAIESYFVHCPVYLNPNPRTAWPASWHERFHRDWSWNARGVYYRHHYSPHWVTGDHTLWLPTVDHGMFDRHDELPRRVRARTFLHHVLDNKRWVKSEYAWEADAWSDVFGHMRNDPALAVDKRECYVNKPEVHAVSATLTGECKTVKRIPDASIGLATFHPEHYQNAIASYELDSERLQALALHRDSSLISDPRIHESSLVYPFLVYEAKGWTGDAREARLQACAAGTAYLDMLDDLARRPGNAGKVEGAYQFHDGRSAQVFALTSFGAHWHVMVGYRRPRLKREHANHPGMSKTVYLYQRIWSGLISDERKAWELLSLVDQIHEWGATTFRDYVIRHLKSWHEYCHELRVADAIRTRAILGKNATSGQFLVFDTPEWAKDFGMDFRTELLRKMGKLLTKKVVEIQAGEPSITCVSGKCRDFGYRLFSAEDFLKHLPSVHYEQVNDSCKNAAKELFDDCVAEMEELLQGIQAREEPLQDLLSKAGSLQEIASSISKRKLSMGGACEGSGNRPRTCYGSCD
ncbi:hypothetical protein DE146DRAFT_657073 [Phaeosphaeria sp. MPI-PUGE-AT-0046c]|nr:hypothetical protein DE146DRAFT_657073 [Phaeosphaeria sp. MPI-PUGE-AT-0046c]